MGAFLGASSVLPSSTGLSVFIGTYVVQYVHVCRLARENLHLVQLSQPHLSPSMQYVNWPFAPYFPFRNKSKQDFRFDTMHLTKFIQKTI